eukprot:g3351.t1
MSLSVVREDVPNDGLGPDSDDSDAAATIGFEDFGEEQIADIPRVEFVPRERPSSVERPRDNVGHGRGASVEAQEEDLQVQRVRGRLNLAMVDATFEDVSDSAAIIDPPAQPPGGTGKLPQGVDQGKVSKVEGDLGEGKTSTSGSHKMSRNISMSQSSTSEPCVIAGTKELTDDLSKAEAQRLQNEFASYIKQGKEFAKQSLISRLEAELIDVERTASRKRSGPNPATEFSKDTGIEDDDGIADYGSDDEDFVDFAALKVKVERAVQEEKARTDKVKRNRARTYKARMKENEQLKRERREWMESQARNQEKLKLAASNQRRENRKRAKKAAERAAAIQKIREEKQRLYNERLHKGSSRMEEQEKRMAMLQREKKRLMREKAKKAAQQNSYRKKVASDRREREERRAEEARARMAKKEGYVRRIQNMKKLEQEQKKRKSALKAITLQERRERIRRQQEYGRKALAIKHKSQVEQQKKLKALEKAVILERRKMYKEQLIEKHKISASAGSLERNQMPGPGAYKIPTTLNLNGGRKIGKSSAASYLDVAVSRASQIPAPGEYGEADYRPRPKVVKFSTAFVPSELDWAIMRARELPAPDAYQSKISKGIGLEGTQSFSMGKNQAKSDIDFVISRSETKEVGAAE